MNNKSIISLIKELKTFLKEKRKLSYEDPSINPVSSLAHLLSRKFVNNEIDLIKINSIIENLSNELIVQRAFNLNKSYGLKIKKVVSKITKENKLLTFRDFKKFWSSNRVGSVFTAHPTFNLNNDAWNNIVNADALIKKRKKFPNIKHRSINKIDLDDEHKAAINAIDNFWNVVNELNKEVLNLGQKKWPSEFKIFLPSVINCASWVGYDLDGRADINWIDSFTFRLKEKSLMLEKLERQIKNLFKYKDENIHKELELILKKINFLKLNASEIISLIKSNNLNDLKNFDEKLEKLRDQSNSKYFVQKLLKQAKLTKNKNLSNELLIIASEISNKGFGIGEIHLRFNALQLHNALKGVMDISIASASVRTDLNRLSKLIDDVKYQEIYFQDIDKEPTTAKRQLMLASLILKYIDNSVPIRLLIAECDHPATILSALYFAKKYGINNSLDISPLFETANSIERGARILEQVLDCKPFIKNIQNRKRICIQTGFSDAGRFMGQITSSLAVERLQVKLSEVFKEKINKNIEVIIFNTHGESLGRGGHPDGILERNQYIFSAFARDSFRKKGFSFKHETSFQGGDGFLRFGNKSIAEETISSVLISELVNKNYNDDPFYKETDFALDFFITLKNWHEKLYINPDYWQLLDLFSNNLIVPSGSRTNKRSTDFSNIRKDPSQIRAISHNAILQQYGYLAHIAGGLGTAVNVDIEKFEYLKKYSKRFQQLLRVGFVAKKLSSLNTPLAYTLILDPSYWVGRSYSNSEKKMRYAFRKLSKALENDNRSESVKRLVTMLRDDALDFHSIVSNELNLHPENEERTSLDLLQSLRISLMSHTLLLTSQIPSFSARDNLSPEILISSALKMDLVNVINQIKIAFPRAKNSNVKQSPKNLNDNYKIIQKKFIEPISKCNDLILEIGVLISHAFNAHG